jgi:hypothetical protein
MTSITLQNKDILTFNDSILTLRAISSELFPHTNSHINIISTVPHRHILRASFEPTTRTLSVPYIAKENKKHYTLSVFEGVVQESNIPHAKQWVESLMKTIYEGKTLSFFNIYTASN